jgi:flagellar biosynthesis protein FlhF
MHLKRYRAQTVQEALAQARADLGRDALVLSTRLVAVAGLRGWLGAREVEISAAADDQVSEIRRPTGSADSRPTLRDRIDRPELPEPASAPADPLVARLEATGLDRGLAERVARTLPRAQRRLPTPVAIAAALATHVGGLASGDEPYAPVELFVGPPGAGKTTTIAKIAAQERARRGAKLSLLAADGFRVGAVEQLRLYADIIGSPFAVARTPAEIERSLLTIKSPVLVDTAGRSIGDARALEVASMLSALPGVRTHLVLPAGVSPREAGRLLDVYGDRARRVVLTRVDEADSIAALLPLLQERDLVVSYLGTGQRVPDDLLRADSQTLARHIVGLDAPIGAPA